MWVYDSAGNIRYKKIFAYTTAATLGTPTQTVNYTYGNSNWGDQLTAMGNRSFTYDQIGNVLTDGNRTYTWKHGRQLATLTQGGKTWTNTYNADGLRVKRTDGTNTYQYYYSEGKLICIYRNSTRSFIAYNPEGLPYYITYGGDYYLYALNLQGDVVAILNEAGQAVVEYTYDAWGNILSITGSMASTLGQFNPLRYRGYVYDNETGLYYLQSRYYDPEIGRFINADGFVSTGQGILGNNMYAYCGNNPVKNIDPSGACYYGADGKWYHDNWEYIGGYERKPDPGYYQGTTPSGLDVYIAPTTNYSTPPNAVKVVDARDSVDSDGKPNPDIQVRNSYKYTKRTDQIGILALIDKYNILNPSLNKWNRTQSSLFIEWDLHNHLYSLFELDNFKHADLDQNDEHLIINLFNRLRN